VSIDYERRGQRSGTLGRGFDSRRLHQYHRGMITARPVICRWLCACSTLLGGCAAVDRAILGLEEIHRDPDPTTGYAPAVPWRNSWWGIRFEVAHLLGIDLSEPKARAVQDPIQYCIDRLEKLQEAAPDLEDHRRLRAVIAVAAMTRMDRSRILRSEALRLLEALSLPIVHDFRLETSTVDDEAKVTAQIEPLLAWVEGPTDESGNDDVARIEIAIARFSELRPESIALAEKLLTVGGLALARSEGSAWQKPLQTATRRHAVQLAFLSGLEALNDPVPAVRARAGRLLLLLDPAEASRRIGRMYGGFEDGVTKVALLLTLQESKVAPADLDPTFRRGMWNDVENGEAAVSAWARWSLARLLGVDPRTITRDELRSRWESLPGWSAEG